MTMTTSRQDRRRELSQEQICEVATALEIELADMRRKVRHLSAIAGGKIGETLAKIVINESDAPAPGLAVIFKTIPELLSLGSVRPEAMVEFGPAKVDDEYFPMVEVLRAWAWLGDSMWRLGDSMWMNDEEEITETPGRWHEDTDGYHFGNLFKRMDGLIYLAYQDFMVVPCRDLEHGTKIAVSAKEAWEKRNEAVRQAMAEINIAFCEAMDKI